MVQSARAAIANVDHVLENAARTLGSSELEILWRVTLPLARRGVIAGLILGGARALGEFGATLMVAGNIPGRTQTLPLAIYDAVQAQRYEQARMMVVVMTAGFCLFVVRAPTEQPQYKRKASIVECATSKVSIERIDLTCSLRLAQRCCLDHSGRKTKPRNAIAGLVTPDKVITLDDASSFLANGASAEICRHGSGESVMSFSSTPFSSSLSGEMAYALWRQPKQAG